MDALGVLRPTETPHATDYVADMVDLVADLVARGVAYETADGVYLSVDTVAGYGLLARQPLDSLRAGARVEAVEGKRSPLDFALWKRAKPGEPSWELAVGPRPTRLAHRVRRHVARPARRRTSTSTAAARTSRSRTTRTSGRRPSPRAGRSPGTGSTTAG